MTRPSCSGWSVTSGSRDGLRTPMVALAGQEEVRVHRVRESEEQMSADQPLTGDEVATIKEHYEAVTPGTSHEADDVMRLVAAVERLQEEVRRLEARIWQMGAGRNYV